MNAREMIKAEEDATRITYQVCPGTGKPNVFAVRETYLAAAERVIERQGAEIERLQKNELAAINALYFDALGKPDLATAIFSIKEKLRLSEARAVAAEQEVERLKSSLTAALDSDHNWEREAYTARLDRMVAAIYGVDGGGPETSGDVVVDATEILSAIDAHVAAQKREG